MFKRAFAIIALLAAVGSISQQVSADVPYLIPVVGKLTDASGTSLEGDHVLAFALYDAQTGGTPLWSDTFSAVEFTSGLFNVYLGIPENKPLEIEIFLGTDEIWLEIQVDNDNPMSRVRLASVPWAMECEQIGNISADEIMQNCTSTQYLQGWDENGPICIEDRLKSVTEDSGTVTVTGDLTVTKTVDAQGGLSRNMRPSDNQMLELEHVEEQQELVCEAGFRAIGCSVWKSVQTGAADNWYCRVAASGKCIFYLDKEGEWDEDKTEGYCYCLKIK
jgi:hypothetical protein